jgi:hypothetical protein
VSSPFAIAATTRVLASFLESRLAAADPDGTFGFAATTTSPPDRVAEAVPGAPHLNLFLFALVDTTLHGLEGRQSPQFYELHYLVSAYGSDIEAQAALGIAVAALAATPVLASATIAAQFVPPLSPVDARLQASSLGAQAWTIAVTPLPLALADLMDLWTTMGGRFRTSVAYRVSPIVVGP